MDKQQQSAISRANAIKQHQHERYIASSPQHPEHKAQLRKLIIQALEAHGPMMASKIRLRMPEAYRPGVVAMLRVMLNDGTLAAGTHCMKGTSYNVYRLPHKPDQANPWAGLLTH